MRHRPDVVLAAVGVAEQRARQLARADAQLGKRLAQMTFGVICPRG